VLPVANNTNMTFRTPQEFTDSVYFCNFYEKTDESDGGVYQTIYASDTRYFPGSTIELKSDNHPAAVGNVTINFSALKNIRDFAASSSASVSKVSNVGQLVMGLSQTSSDLLLVFKTTDGLGYYKYYDAIAVGSVLTIASLDDFKIMKKTPFEPNANTFSSFTYGGKRNGTSYSFGDDNASLGSSSSLYSPDELFFKSYYFFLTSYGNDGYSYVHYSEGVTSLPTSITEISADVKTRSVKGNILTFSITGPSDYNEIMTDAYISNGTENSQWSLNISSSSTQFVVPDVPPILTNTFSFPALNQFDFTSWDLRNTIWFGDKNSEPYEVRSKRKNFNPNNSGGRKITARDQDGMFRDFVKNKNRLIP